MIFLFPLSLLGWYVRIRNTLKAIFVFRERFIYVSSLSTITTPYDMTYIIQYTYPIYCGTFFFSIYYLPTVVLLTSIDGME